MSNSPYSSHILRSGFVLLEPVTPAVMRAVVRQYASGGDAR